MLPWPMRRVTAKRSVPWNGSSAASGIFHSMRCGLEMQPGTELELARRSSLLEAAIRDAPHAVLHRRLRKYSGPEGVVDLGEVAPVEKVERVEHQVERDSVAEADALGYTEVHSK